VLRHILEEGFAVRMTVAALLVAGAAASVWAQSPAFEVSAVKPNHTEEHPRTYPRLHNGTFSAEAASMKTLLVIAYGLIDQRINGPAWLDSERYDITAKAPDGISDSQIMPLLQSLLKDRFHLESHFEMKEMPAYDMVVSKGGAKLKPFDPARLPDVPRDSHAEAVMVGVGSVGQLGDILARAAGRPVVDKTGMEGLFSWTLSYTPLSTSGTADSAAPDIFAAIEQQLGLKLEPRKESLQILVIDHMERIPTEN
jgi:bla regulator protein BlaR1